MKKNDEEERRKRTNKDRMEKAVIKERGNKRRGKGN